MMNTEPRIRTVMLSETRGFLTNELAETIAAMFNSQQDSDPFDKLSKVMFQVRYATLERERKMSSYPESMLDEMITDLRLLLEYAQEFVEAEDFKERHAEFLRETIEDPDEHSIYRLMAALQLRHPDSDSDLRDSYRAIAGELNEDLNKLERIATITDDAEQNEALADYQIKKWISDIRAGIHKAENANSFLVEPQDITEDIEDSIKTNYLDMILVSELERLAQIFGLDPIETPTARFLRLSKEKRAKEKSESSEKKDRS